MNPTICRAFLGALLCLVPAPWTEDLPARDYIFTRIADTSGTFSNFGQAYGAAPAINDQGDVAFYAQLDDLSAGIYRADGGVAVDTSMLVGHDATSTFRFFSVRPSFNNSGQVAFQGYFMQPGCQCNTSGIFIAGVGGVGRIYNPLVTGSQPPYPINDIRDPAINDAGVVTFSGTFRYSSGGSAVFKGTTQEPTSFYPPSVYDDTNNVRGLFLEYPDINTEGILAFSAEVGGVSGVYTGMGGAVTSIADKLREPFISSFDAMSDVPVAVNDSGAVAFAFDPRPTYSQIKYPSLFVANGTTIETRATSANGYWGFEAFSLNEHGAIAFTSSGLTLNRGIYTGSDPVADKVIAEGDSLFGSTVSHFFGFQRQGLNNNGQLAFSVRLTDGTEAIVVATPTPECMIADANCDGHVDRADAAILARNFGVTAGATRDRGDFDGNGLTSLADLSILQANLDQSPVAATPVPEPGTVLLAIIALASLKTRYRKLRRCDSEVGRLLR